MKSTYPGKPLMRMLFVFVFVFTSFIAIRADVIADWNLITLQEAVAAGRPGGAPAIDLGTVHAAMYDAVQAIEKDYDPYRVTDVPNANGSPVAAAAKAARDVLMARFPARADAINTIYVNYLTANGINPSDPGVAVGTYVAGKLLAYRSCDGSLPIPAPTFVGGMGIGQWRPTPAGANGVSSSAMFSMEHFFGTDHMDFSMTTTNSGPTILDTRDYTRFSQATQEVIDGRVLLGIHFRFADEASVKLGQNVVKWGFQNYLRPSK